MVRKEVIMASAQMHRTQSSVSRPVRTLLRSLSHLPSKQTRIDRNVFLTTIRRGSLVVQGALQKLQEDLIPCSRHDCVGRYHGPEL